MLNVRKMIRTEADAASTLFDPGSTPTEDVLIQYQWHFDELAKKFGFACDGCKIRAVARASADGKLPEFVMTIRLERWIGKRSLLLLLSLPVLEQSVRRALRSSWLLDVSTFGGVWFNASNVIGVPTSFTRKLVQLIEWLAAPEREVRIPDEGPETVRSPAC